MLTILYDGIAYGMLLFVLACGLSVTLGLMNFINLAHGAFAMAGGYCTVMLVNRFGMPFALGLPIAFLATALLGGFFERTLYVHVYARSHLDQVLFTIGLVFMAVAAVDYTMGSSQQFVQIPQALQGQFDVFGIAMSKYRLLIIAVCGVLTIALQLILTRTRFGSRLRAAVDDQRVARGLGINVGAVFAVTFAVGSGLRPDLSAQIHDLLFDRGDGWRHLEHYRAVPCLDPARHRRCRRQVLRAHAGRFRHLCDHDRRFAVAAARAVRPQHGAVRRMTPLAQNVAGFLHRRARWSVPEIAFWALAFAAIWLFPQKHLILTETAILALFALSLDLILGYAGIISLGHAAFFGAAGYVAGLVAKYGIVNEPVLALLCSGLVAAALGFVTSFLLLRGSDLTRLMVTLGIALMLGEVANRYSNITGGADGLQGITIAPILGRFEFDIFGHTGYVYCLTVLFICFLLARRIVASPFGLSLRAVKGNALRAAAVGIPVNRRLVAIYTVSAFLAGIAGALLTQTTAFCSLDVLSLERSADLLLVLIIGGTGYLYGGLIGAVIYKFTQDWIATLTPQYWQFWIGLMLVLIVLIGRERMAGWNEEARAFLMRLGGRLFARKPAERSAAPERRRW
jgi:branched-chain amino acid transport system permease protein